MHDYNSETFELCLRIIHFVQRTHNKKRTENN